MRQGIKFNEVREYINSEFPPVKFAFAYGSAAFTQANYDYSSNPMLDLIYVVEDTKEWHYQNIKKNGKHYSGLSWLFGASYLDYLQSHLSPIHFNPFIQMEDYRLKYGVIGEEEFRKDLKLWKTLIVSGRLHKPVRHLIKCSEYDDLIADNLKKAVATTIFLDNRDMIPETEFFETLVGLSYLGDIRFTLGGENQNKVAAIVKGSLEDLRKLYQPIIKSKELSPFLTYDPPIFKFKNSAENRRAAMELIPPYFGKFLVGQAKDFQSLLWKLTVEEQKRMVIDSLTNFNSYNSRNMLYYHMLTVSPWNNVKYALQKLKKAAKK